MPFVNYTARTNGYIEARSWQGGIAQGISKKAEGGTAGWASTALQKTDSGQGGFRGPPNHPSSPCL